MAIWGHKAKSEKPDDSLTVGAFGVLPNGKPGSQVTFSARKANVTKCKPVLAIPSDKAEGRVHDAMQYAMRRDAWESP
jgi:hypothetical protein